MDETQACSTLLSDIARMAVSRSGEESSWLFGQDEFWCTVVPFGHIAPAQGWKLHVSATTLSAPVVLARVMPILMRFRCAFKFTRDLYAVSKQNSPNADRGSSGKFITVYPEEDTLRQVAQELHLATLRLPGPKILSDRQLCPGSLVYYRYGSFQAEKTLNDFGRFVPVLSGPDGQQVVDLRTARFNAPSWARDPFTSDGSAKPAKANATRVRLAERFTVERVLKHANRGGVFVAIDEHSGTQVVVKQGRAHVGCDIDGSDARDAIRHEALMLDSLAPLGITPAKVALFEQQGDVFLAQELLSGRTLEEWARDEAAGKCMPPGRAMHVAKLLVDLLTMVHAESVILQDLKPGNVMVLPDGDLRLIDLEHAVRPGAPGRKVFTRGFSAARTEPVSGSPDGLVPEVSDDLFSLGATLFYAVTAIPTWELPEGKAERPFSAVLRDAVILAGSDHSGLSAVAPLVLGLTDPDPHSQWSLKQASAFLSTLETEPPAAAFSSVRTGIFRAQADMGRALTDGLTYLVSALTPENTSHLWTPADSDEQATDPCNARNGAASLLPLLTDAAAYTGREDVHQAAVAAARWVGDRSFTVPRFLPGLHSGRAGTAVALHAASRYLKVPELAGQAVELAARLPIRWPNPDLTHGLAGAGMAHLHLWRATGREDLWSRACHYADVVLAMAERHEGAMQWATPDSRGGSSRRVPGFAHGAAGIGAFLLKAAEATEVQEYMDAAIGVARTLADTVDIEDGGAIWRKSSPSHSVNWCSGSTGIGGFMLHMWINTGEPRYLELAEQAAAAAKRLIWHQSSGYCCGIPGIGSFFLDLAEATGDRRYVQAAEDAARILLTRHTLVNGLLVVLPTNIARKPLIGYGNGIAGVLGFLLRLQYEGDNALIFGALSSC